VKCRLCSPVHNSVLPGAPRQLFAKVQTVFRQVNSNVFHSTAAQVYCIVASAVAAQQTQINTGCIDIDDWAVYSPAIRPKGHWEQRAQTHALKITPLHLRTRFLATGKRFKESLPAMRSSRNKQQARQLGCVNACISMGLYAAAKRIEKATTAGLLFSHMLHKQVYLHVQASFMDSAGSAWHAVQYGNLEVRQSHDIL
jgi:hypothetical protein